MSNYSNDPRKSRELQMPAQRSSSSRTTKPAVRTNNAAPSAQRKSSAAGNNPQMRRKPSGKRKKAMTKKKRFKILFTTMACILILSVLSIAAVYGVKAWKIANSINTDKSFSDKDVESNFDDDTSAAHMSGYLNIAIFGIDTRNVMDDDTEQIDDTDCRSDVIMIVSVNQSTNEIKLLSVYRDTYLYVGSDKKGDIKCDKINHAYVNGQAVNAINALNRNLDLTITDYVTVDFGIVAECIDAVGGIDVEILDREIERFNKDGSYRDAYPLINHYIDEINELTNSNSPHITKSGVQHLDGVQATAYARIRYCDTDYQRSERQRTVLMKTFEKAKSSDISTLLKIAETVAPKVVTSLDWSEIATYAKYAVTCDIVDQQGFPFTMSSSNHLSGSNTWYNFADDLGEQVTQLHKYLFNQENYKPTSMVMTISDYIDKKRGNSSDGTYSYSKDDTEQSSPTPDADDSEETYSTLEPATQSPTSKVTAVPSTSTPEEYQTVAPEVTPTPSWITAMPTKTPAPTTAAPTETPVATPTEEPDEPDNSISVEDPDDQDEDDPNNY